MRTLKFIVSGQKIEKDPSCDFCGLVAGTSGYLQAEFAFDFEWKGCVKAASFWRLGKEYGAILKDNRCMIPAEALTWWYFGVSVTGKRKDGYKITTNRIEVTQGKEE